MKKLIVIIVFFTSYLSSVIAQDPQTNLKKYWKFREKLKNFVISGDCTGCGVPAGTVQQQDASFIPTLRYDDSGIRVGMYISMLAMEYRLLYNNGQNLDAITKELYYAIETLNRLDRNAEDFWSGWDTNPNYASDVQSLTPTNTDLNGFFIRDDVKNADNFLYQYHADGRRIIDHLTSCQIPLNPRLIPKKIDSGFTIGIDQSIGPREESLDQVVNIYMGLALVKGLLSDIPGGVNYNGLRFNNDSPTEPSDFVQGVQKISNRINDHMRNGGDWQIHNPEHDGCVFGTCGANDPTNENCLLASCGGGDVSILSYGFDMINCYIQGWEDCDDPLSNHFHEELYLPNPRLLATDLYYIEDWIDDNIGDPLLNELASLVGGFLGTIITLAVEPFTSSYLIWQTFLKSDNVPFDALEGDEDKIITLASIFNPWGTAWTHNNVAQRGLNQKKEFADLLECVLHNRTPVLPPSHYECMLNDLECDGETPGGLNWTVEDRFVYGQNTSCDGNPSPCNGTNNGIFEPTYLLDYLIYFNLYCLANPNYLGSAFQYIPPTLLAPNDITLQNVSEQTERNYIAARSITALGVPSTPDVYDLDDTYAIDDFGNVSFKSGQEINLLPGFNTLNSGLFSAQIDNSIESFECSNPSYYCTTNCTNLDDEEQPSSNNQNDIKTYSFSPNLMWATSGNTIFKLYERGKVGDNMFQLCASGYYGAGVIQTCSVPVDMRSWIGHHRFASRIVDVKYVNNRTWIFTENGDVLKLLDECHGYYLNPFGVIQNSSFDPDAFTPTDNLSYDGDMRFKNNITAVEYVAPYLFIGFDNGLLLKATTDGTGHNVFKIDQIGQNNIENIPGSNIYAGDIKFCSAITEIKYLSSSNQLLVATQDGLTVKINGTGEFGENMFGLSFDCNAPSITSHTGSSWVGDAVFSSPVVNADMLNGDLFVSSSNGEIKAFTNSGGAGSNWANYDVRGSQDFNAPIMSMNYDEYYNLSILNFKDGRLLKINGTGGSGNDMFNVTETTRGFQTSDPATQPENYFLGCMFFEGTGITSFNNIDGNVFIGLENGKLLKVAGYGTDGENMYRLGGNQNLQNLCENYYLIGKQNFPAIGAYRTAQNEPEMVKGINKSSINIYPNPNTGTFNISLPESEVEEIIKGSISDVSGRVVKSFEIGRNNKASIYTVDASKLSNGTYFLILNTQLDKKVTRIDINK